MTWYVLSNKGIESTRTERRYADDDVSLLRLVGTKAWVTDDPNFVIPAEVQTDAGVSDD